MKQSDQALQGRKLIGSLLATILLFAVSTEGWGREVEVRMTVFALRHGIRHPTPAPPDLQLYAQNRYWSPWYTTQYGCLTANGVRVEEKLGAYYRKVLLAEGLIPESCPADDQYYLRADSFQRTWWSARAFADGLYPGCQATVYAINAQAYQTQVPRPFGDLTCTSENDPLFFPLQSSPNPPAMNPTQALLAAAATVGARGDAKVVDTPRLTEANHSPIAEMQAATDCCQPSACPNLPEGQLCTLERLSAQLTSSATGVSLSGPVNIGGTLAATFLMAYMDGLPMEDVAFGRLTLEQLNPTFALNNQDFGVSYGTPYVAEAQMSNWMNQILLALQQRVDGVKRPNAVALPSNRVALFLGHDDNLHGLGALMGVSWINKGYQPQQTPPGSGFVFTLIREKGTGRHYVRTDFIAQSPDQQRNISELTLSDPPSQVPLQIPGCQSPSDLPYFCRLEDFVRIVRRSVNPKYLTRVQSLR